MQRIITFIIFWIKLSHLSIGRTMHISNYDLYCFYQFIFFYYHNYCFLYIFKLLVYKTNKQNLYLSFSITIPSFIPDFFSGIKYTLYKEIIARSKGLPEVRSDYPLLRITIYNEDLNDNNKMRRIILIAVRVQTIAYNIGNCELL